MNLQYYITLLESNPNNPAFKSWFSGSKIVDKNGNPLKVYHGTLADIKSFIPGDGRNGTALGKNVIYFTADPKFAEGYTKETAAEARSDGRRFPKNHQPGANIVPVYLRVENPLIYQAGMPVGDELVEIAKKNGNDGIIFSTGKDDVNKYREIVVFNSEQVKSAISNTGEYKGKNIHENILSETLIKLEMRYGVLPVWKNPSSSQMENLFKKYGVLRGIIDPKGYLYVWDAQEATHDDIDEILECGIIHRFMMNKSTVTTQYNDSKELENSISLKRAYRKPFNVEKDED